MDASFSLPTTLTVIAAVLGALLAAIVPTCLYLYVEPRGRKQWVAAAGGATAPGVRKAPFVVRFTAWLSFAVGQMAIPWLLVPGACAVLLYLQTKLGMARPIGLGITAALGVAALSQAVLAFRLLPLGVRLLAHDHKACASVSARARRNAVVSALLLAGGGGLSVAIANPHFVHPWLAVVLSWAALRPVMIYAGVCLVHALLLGRCSRALSCEVDGSRSV
jgi:hypothetical protein